MVLRHLRRFRRLIKSQLAVSLCFLVLLCGDAMADQVAGLDMNK